MGFVTEKNKNERVKNVGPSPETQTMDSIADIFYSINSVPEQGEIALQTEKWRETF